MKRKLPDLDPRPARKRVLSDEERGLWEEATERVVAGTAERAGKEAFGKKKAASPPKKKEKIAVSLPPSKKKPPGVKPLIPGAVDAIDRRNAERLRKGRREIEATLDLHGMTQEKAHRALSAFIECAAAKGKRTLLVITGKGEKGKGVLRGMLPKWLAESALRPQILAMTPAAPKDGGDGAFYVLLRRKR